MISSDIIRGYNDTIVLSILKKQDSYGYGVSKEIENISKGNYIIKETTLYSAFNRLEKNGYLLSYTGSESGGRPRTYYTITESGLNYYKEKLIEWEVTQKVINNFIEEVENDKD